MLMIVTGRVCCTCFDDEWQKQSWVKHSKVNHSLTLSYNVSLVEAFSQTTLPESGMKRRMRR